MSAAAALLLASTLTSGQTIVVTATRDERPLHAQAGNTAVIGGDDIDRVAPTHPAELFARAAGAWVTRGSSQEHLTAIRSPILTGPGACGAFLFLEDGLPTRAAGFCNVNGLFELDLAGARSVEVVRGPGSALYGSNALHGLVNVLTPRVGDGGHARVDAGGYGYLRAAAAFDDGERWRAGAAFAHDDGWRDGTGFDHAHLGVRVRAAGAEWSLSAMSLAQDTAGFVVGADAYRDLALARSDPTPGAFRDADAQRISATFGGDAGAWRYSIRPYARRTWMRFSQHFIPGEPVETNGHASAGIQALFRRGALVAGADLEATRGSVEQFQATPLTDASPFLNETRPQGDHYDFDVSASTGALFAQADLSPAARWRVSVGARVERTRYDYDNRIGDGNLRDDGTPCGMGGCHYNRPADRRDAFTSWTPKLGVAHELGDATVYLSFAGGFRAPQVNELYRLQRGQDVADLEPERLGSVELGVRGVAGRTQFDAAVFAMRKRSVVFQDASGFAVSGGRTRHHGVELSLVQPLVATIEFALDGTIARHTYDFDRGLAGGETIVRGAEVDTAPRHLGSARVRWSPRDGHDVEIEAARTGAHWLDPANAHRYHGHTLVHLRGRHALARGWQFGWRATNLADRAYAERADFAFGDFRYFPGPPRTVMLSLYYRVI